MKQLHERYGDRVRFFDVSVRQAHPGELRGAYRTYEEKLEGAREYKREENLPWPLLVDDYAGTVHKAYSGEMADPVFLIDSEGKVSFYGMWTHAPTLKKALDELLARGGRGIALGIDRTPHLFASFVDGWRGPRRGGMRAVLEYDLGGFGAGTLSFLGNKAKPVLGPLALRAAPLPTSAKLVLASGLAVAAASAVGLLRRGRG
ncbi:MAG: hypothetical protein H0X67_06895 [Acidobacteria bacterium]|jgi:hypothetical protein|nr:hypothetical protein [Acidobacteriota bacterium]